MSRQQPSKTNSGSSPTPSTSTTTYSLNDLRDEVYDWAQRKGWWDTADDKNIPSKLALVHSEVSEALEDFRNGKMTRYYSSGRDSAPLQLMSRPDGTIWALGHLDLNEDGSVKGMTVSDLSSEWFPMTEDLWLQLGWKPEGFASELVDVIIRIVDLAGFLDIDLDHEVALKLAYNEKREYRHGGKKA